MHALVTGGAGFIGSHLTTALLDNGHAVRVLDDLSQGRREYVDPRAEFHEGSITDRLTCDQAVTGVSHIFHLAAMSRSGPSANALDECLAVNVYGTANMLQAADAAGVSRFVYSASSTCYGNSPTPHGPDTPIDLLNPYGWSKYTGEQLCLMFDRTHELDVVSLRYFNVYGRREPKTGPYALVLGIFTGRWAAGLPLEIHGSGSQRRDFVHVSDVVNCNLLAANSSVHGMALNVGRGENVSVQELADMISEQQVHGPKRTGDSVATLADISQTKLLLGWSPKIAIADGVKEALESASCLA